MFSFLSIKLKKRFYEKYNIFFSFLQRVPLVKRLIPKNIFSIIWMEDFIIPLGVITKLISSIFLWIVLLSYSVLGMSQTLHDFFSVKEIFGSGFSESIKLEDYNIYFLGLLFISNIIFCIIEVYDLNNKDSYINIKRVRVNPKDYIMGSLFYKHFFGFFGLVISLYMIFNIKNIDIDIIGVVNFSLILKGVSIFLFSIYLKLKFKDRKEIEKNNIIILIGLCIVILLSVIYPLFSNKIINFRFLFTNIMGVMGIIFILISSFLIYTNKNMENVIFNFLEYKKIMDIELNIKEKEREISFNRIKKEKDYSKYLGYEYINRVTFDRIRDESLIAIIRNNILYSAIIIIVCILTFTPLFDKAINYLEVENILINNMFVVFATIIYIFSINDIFIKKCFYALDSKLINKKYYREFNKIWVTFKLRFVEMLRINLIKMILTQLGFLFICYRLNFSFYEIFIVELFGIFSFIFSVYINLMVYFIFQPYTKDNTLGINQYMKLIKLFFYFICIISILNNTFSYLLFTILILIILSLILLKYFAPKNFKLK